MPMTMPPATRVLAWASSSGVTSSRRMSSKTLNMASTAAATFSTAQSVPATNAPPWRPGWKTPWTP